MAYLEFFFAGYNRTKIEISDFSVIFHPMSRFFIKLSTFSMRSPVVHLEKNGRPLPHGEGGTVLTNGRDLITDGDASSGYGTMRNGASLPVS